MQLAETYAIAEELSHAEAAIGELKRIHAPAEHHAASRIQATLRALIGQLLTDAPAADPMRAARTIADAACCIDTIKLIHPPGRIQTALVQAERLHDIAQRLAGERVSELYGPAEEGVAA